MAQFTTKSHPSLHLFGRDFTPKLLPSLFLLLFVPLFCVLGTWQYHRSQYKTQLLADYAARAKAAPLSLQKILQKPEREFYPIKVRGVLDTEHQLLVENKFYQHRLGYVVLTPLKLRHGKSVLINRGWVARDRVKSIWAKPKRVTVTGIVHTPPKKTFQIGRIDTQDNWPRLLQNNSWREISRALPSWHLHPFLIVLDKKSPLSFTPIYQPTIMPPEKHMGYAVQWFAMALTVLIIWLVLGFRH